MGGGSNSVMYFVGVVLHHSLRRLGNPSSTEEGLQLLLVRIMTPTTDPSFLPHQSVQVLRLFLHISLIRWREGGGYSLDPLLVRCG